MTNDKLFMGKNGFIWFVGRVEDNSDPLGIGRVRVRIHGWHTGWDDETYADLPTEALPWALPIMPITSAGIGGIGESPIGPQKNTRVIGFFLDGILGQQPMIFGVLAGETRGLNRDGTLAREVIPGALPYGTTAHQPNQDPLVGLSVYGNEECPDGYDQGSSTVNAEPPDPRLLALNKSDWSVPCTGFVSSEYGSRGGRHHGVDICPAGFYQQTDAGAGHLGGKLTGPVGNPIYAAASGTVIKVWKKSLGQHQVHTNYDSTGTGSRSYGNAVAIQHSLNGQPYISIYAHLGTSQDAASDGDRSGVLVSEKQHVSKGQQIGVMGRTHNFNSPTHLHFEIRVGTALPKSNNHINPGKIFPQMAHTHTSILSWVRAQLDYSVEPHYIPDEAPCIALEGPK